MTLDQVKAELKQILKRDVEVEALTTGKFIAQYVSYNMKPSALVGDTEEVALRLLLDYLKGSQSKETQDNVDTETDTGPT